MANQWLRLWHDMPNDPKFKTISKLAKQHITAVIAVYVHLLVSASSNADERGRTQVNSEDLASATDLDIEQVESIIASMQGRLLDGDVVSGWEKRQPKREDGSSERSRAWRESQKNLDGSELNRTQANAGERKKTQDKEEDKDKKKRESASTRISAEWHLSEELKAIAKDVRPEWPDHHIQYVADNFRDYWVAKSGKDAVKKDWIATWRRWCREEKSSIRSAGGQTTFASPTPPKRKPMPMPGPRAPKPEGMDFNV
jgi:hypothetical protein